MRFTSKKTGLILLLMAPIAYAGGSSLPPQRHPAVVRAPSTAISGPMLLPMLRLPQFGR